MIMSRHPNSGQKDNVKIANELFQIPVVLYGCETWSLTLGQEHRLRVFENGVIRRIFGPKRRKTGHGENCIMMNFTACILHRILLA